MATIRKGALVLAPVVLAQIPQPPGPSRSSSATDADFPARPALPFKSLLDYLEGGHTPREFLEQSVCDAWSGLDKIEKDSPAQSSGSERPARWC